MKRFRYSRGGFRKSAVAAVIFAAIAIFSLPYIPGTSNGSLLFEPAVAHAVDIVDANGNYPGTNKPVGVQSNEPTVADAAKDAAKGVCAITDMGTCVKKALGSVVAAVFWAFFIAVPGLLLSAAGMLLNFVMLHYVADFSRQIGGIAAIPVAWATVRDVANIAFIAALVAMSIATILQVQSYGAKKLLASLIVAALLINFSLFFTKIVIDLSGALSLNLYTAVLQASTGGKSQTGCDPTAVGNALHNSSASGTQQGAFSALQGCVSVGPTGFIMQKSGLASSFTDFSTIVNKVSDDPLNLAPAMFLTGILMLILAFVFFAAGIMLISRAIILAFLMVLSPFGIVGLVIPQMTKLGKDWWKTLFDQAFFAPAYFLLLYISFVVINGLPDLATTSTSLVSGLFSGNVDVISILANYILIAGFMIGSIIIAKKMGAFGADFAVKTAGRLSFGAEGEVLRRIVGGPADWAARRLQNSAFGTIPGIGTGTVAAFKNIGRSSFDLRNATGVKDLSIQGVKPFGEGTKLGGFEQRRKAEESKKKSYGYDLDNKRIIGQSPEQKKNAQTMRENETVAENDYAAGGGDQRLTQLKDIVPVLQQTLTTLNDDLKVRQQALKKEEDTLAFMQKNGASPEKIAEQQARVDEARTGMAEVEKKIAEATQQIGDSQKELAEHQQRKEVRDRAREGREAAESQGETAQQRYGRLLEQGPLVGPLKALEGPAALFTYRQADKSAGSKVRGGKSDTDKLLDILKEGAAKGEVPADKKKELEGLLGKGKK